MESTVRIKNQECGLPLMSFSCPWILRADALLAIQESTRLVSLSWTLVNWWRNLNSYHRDTSAPDTEANPFSSAIQNGRGIKILAL
jgi:hypothetical protein